MKLGRQCKCGPFKYRIEATKEAMAHLESQDCYGIVNHHQRVMWIRPNLTLQQLLVTVIHEGLHIVDRVYLNEKMGEAQVSVMANGLAQLLESLGFELTYE